MSQILIVEDETIIRRALRRFLEKNQFTVADAGSVDEAVTKFDLTSFQLIISDLRLPGAPGTDLIKKASNVPVLIITSYASMRSAIDAMKMGAVDYIAKPFDHEEMLSTVKQLLQRNTQSETKPTSPHSTPAITMIGRCPAMQQLLTRIDKVAKTDATVLIQGESGTGKELAARAIHQQSQRASKALISVNCASIPETLIESELFGHEKGAFTGANSSREGLLEAANGGTLFLDEIGELPLEAQARLLRFLQEGEIRKVGSVQSKQVDVRLITATHRNLKTMVSQGLFREDLYYRLYVMEIQMPPLRERGEDIAELAEQLLKQSSQKFSRPSLKFDQHCLAMMQRYRWPGNVREMKNAIKRAVILADDSNITWSSLGLDNDQLETPSESAGENNISAPQSMDGYFQQYVLEHQSNMSETELAKQLGISRKCLWERRQKLGIPRKLKK